MKEFENLKSQWNAQTEQTAPNDGANSIIKTVVGIKAKQKISNIILGITMAVLLGFALYVSAYKATTAMIALSLMIGILVVRIAVEMISITNLSKLNPAEDAEKYKSNLINYYAKRKKVHFILTPLLILIYCVGFVMLMPYFKSSLSEGFYTYIQVSSVIILIILGAFIYRQIKKEMNVLDELKNANS